MRDLFTLRTILCSIIEFYYYNVSLEKCDSCFHKRARNEAAWLARPFVVCNTILYVQSRLQLLFAWFRLHYTLDRELEIEVDVEASTGGYTVHKLIYFAHQLLQALDVPLSVNF